MRPHQFLLALAAAALVRGQGAVSPVILATSNPAPGFGGPALPALDPFRIDLVHLPGSPPEQSYCSISCSSLPWALGGVNGRDLLCGTFDAGTGTFTANAEAAALNTPNHDFDMRVHRSGLYAVMERNFIPPPWQPLPPEARLCVRAAIGQPWIDLALIGPLPPQGAWIPALADFHGATWLVFTQGYDLAMAPIDLVTGQLRATPTVVVRNGAGGAPVLDANDQLVGFSHSLVGSQGNDHYLSLDLDPNTPPIQLYDVNTNLMIGGSAGGRFFDGEYVSPPHLLSFDTCWCTGGRAPIGSIMSVSCYSPPTAGAEVYFSSLLVGAAFLPVGTTVPGLQGLLGLAMGPLSVTAPVMHDNRDGSAVLQFAVPNRTALRGLAVPCQSVTLAASTNRLQFGNTAALTIE